MSSFIMIEDFTLGNHRTVSRYLKGVFNKRPVVPKNVEKGQKISSS